MAAYLPTFNALIAQCAELRRAGSCALDLAHLAAGRLDGFWVMSLKAWDVAAGALLVKEAGAASATSPAARSSCAPTR
jgi:myo-inositol-1(or 4)-monophosphatase